MMLTPLRVMLTEFPTEGDGKAIERIENKMEVIQGTFIFLGPYKEVLFVLGPWKEFSHKYMTRFLLGSILSFQQSTYVPS